MLLAGEDGIVERVHVLEETGKTGRAARERQFAEPFVFLFQKNLTELAQNRALTGFDLRVLLVVLSRATQESPMFDSDPHGLAAEMGANVRQVTASLKTLADEGYIERPKRGKLALNPEIAWRGTAVARMELLVRRRSTENAPGASAPR
jgi:hypothetical protein